RVRTGGRDAPRGRGGHAAEAVDSGLLSLGKSSVLASLQSSVFSLKIADKPLGMVSLGSLQSSVLSLQSREHSPNASKRGKTRLIESSVLVSLQSSVFSLKIADRPLGKSKSSVFRVVSILRMRRSVS
ncbi:MAG: hypothetical protein K2N48_00035, partial [Muribaculaceae bacterium]|nr:hypothetical protein [Muribaculaceae bacterium]